MIQHAMSNMPALVGRTSTMGLTQATVPFVAMRVQQGIERAVAEHTGFAQGVNTRSGRVTFDAVIKTLGFDGWDVRREASDPLPRLSPVGKQATTAHARPWPGFCIAEGNGAGSVAVTGRH